MGRKAIFGKCHICETEGKLSFEHVPPKSAFNDRPLVEQKIEKIFNGEEPNNKGKTLQRGSGAYTLCIPCNNKTGKWYGRAFSEWAHQGLNIMGILNGQSHSLDLPFYVFPLRIIKQILSMFCSSNPYGFIERHPELQQFILNKNQKYIPNELRVFIFYNLSNKMRQIGMSGLLKFNDNFNPIDSYTFSEITFPPFGYVLTKGEKPPDERLQEITYFGNYGYNEWKVLHLNFPVLPVETLYPGDYRNQDEIKKETKQNLEKQKLKSNRTSRST